MITALMCLVIGNTVAAMEMPVPRFEASTDIAAVRVASDILERDSIIEKLVEGLDDMGDDAPLPQEPLQCVFLGNSLVSGLESVSTTDTKFVCKVGVSLKELNKTYTPRAAALEKNTVLIEMGSNELGVYTKEEFIAAYIKAVSSFDCTVYCLSIPPVNEAKSKYAPRVNNVNVKLYNSYIQEVCNEIGATYLDCSEFFGDTLQPSWTGDGLHLKTNIYAQWLDWIQQKLDEKAAG